MPQRANQNRRLITAVPGPRELCAARARGRAPGARGTGCDRCPVGARYPSCGTARAAVARKYVKVATAGAVAGIIVEPMQGTAGNIVPPTEFLPAMQSIAQEVDALFIADEMITGLGRTGTWWGAHHTGVVPDIVTIGKAVGGGFPLSALATTDAITSDEATARNGLAILGEVFDLVAREGWWRA